MKKFTFFLAIGLMFSAQAKADGLYETVTEVCSNEISEFCVNDENFQLIECLQNTNSTLSAGCVVAVSAFNGVSEDTFAEWISLSDQQRQQLQQTGGTVSGVVSEYLSTGNTQ
ncbi:MAG: hypothetical protein ACK5N8_03965 [Alphaproteobacteria bacterium]